MVFLRIMKSSRYLISCWRPQSFWYHAMEFGVIFHLTSRDFWRLEWKAPMVRCDVWHRGLKYIFSTTAITRSTYCKRSERWCYSRDVYNKWFLIKRNVASHIPVDYFTDHCYHKYACPNRHSFLFLFTGAVLVHSTCLVDGGQAYSDKITDLHCKSNIVLPGHVWLGWSCTVCKLLPTRMSYNGNL